MKINENLVLKSDDKNWALASGKIDTNIQWSGGWIKVEHKTTYTFSKYGGNRFFVCLFENEPKLGDDLYSKKILVDLYTENAVKTFTTKENENYLFFYGANNNIKPLYKLEKGTETTLYIPNKADFKDSSLYPTKVGGGYRMGGNTTFIEKRWAYVS